MLRLFFAFVLFVCSFFATQMTVFAENSAVPIPERQKVYTLTHVEYDGDPGGFASAIANKPPVTEYFIKEDTEFINGWSPDSGNEMQGNELNIHGNGNNLDGNGNQGVAIRTGKTMTVDGVGSFNLTAAKKDDEGAFAVIDPEGKIDYFTVEHSDGWTNFVYKGGNYNDGSAFTLDGGELAISNSVFTNNFNGHNNEMHGGAINAWEGALKITNSLFANNKSEGNWYTFGGAIGISNASADISNSIFINNTAHSLTNGQASGGAISSRNYEDTLTITNSVFDRNSAIADVNHADGGAIFVMMGALDVSNSTFTNNLAYTTGYARASGGAISIEMGHGAVNIKNSFFENNKAYSAGTEGSHGAQGGALYVVTMDDATITNSIFKNNSAVVDFPNPDTQAQGGAIYTHSEKLNIVADNGLTLFSGNKTINNGVEDQNAIFVYADEYTSLNLEAKNGGIIQFDDKIKGGSNKWSQEKGSYYEESVNNLFKMNITGDSTGKVILNNNVDYANITVDTVNLNLGKNNVFENSDVTMNSGTLGFINGIAEAQTMHALNINGNINLALDVDLAGEKMDTLPDGTVVSSSSQIGVSYLNLLNDAVKDKTVIAFAPEDYANQIHYTGQTPIAYSPIYKYNVSYNPDDGMFSFIRGSSSGNQSDNFNPSVLAPSIATQAGAYTTQLQTFNYAFQHSDAFMNIPYLDRMSIKNRNKYALSPTGDATDVGTFSPLLTKEESPGFWLKPYASFENIPLKNGPKVSNINYGTLVGYDSSLKSIKNGFDRVLTGYVGYNGASQRYSGIDAYQNGGILGGTATFYKNNFFNATTLSVGATAGDAKTMYGSENYTMLLAGIANKTGYNFEFKEGRIILQPSMLISYSFVNTFDYTNAAGVRIKSDPLNAIQLAPGIKLIGNTKSGWQPYIGVSMIWNLLDKSKVTADDVRLPEMSIKPYVQYGVGVQKRFNDKFTVYGQAMIHSGGRNGIALSGGLKWLVGRK